MDIVRKAYSRIQIRGSQITQQHITDAVMDAQLMQSEWSIRDGGLNLWKRETLQIPLVQGVASYSIPTNVVQITDWYIRQFQTGSATNLGGGAFSTAANSTSVQVNQVNHGMVPGNWIGLPIYVSIDTILLYGFYTVTTVIDANNYTITSATAATNSVSGGGVVPSFAAVAGSSTITVTLPNHGFVANQNFTVFAPTAIGGLTLAGTYPVVSVTNSSTFTITANNPSSLTTVTNVGENGGLAQVQNQLTNTQPIDFVIYPISTTEYDDQPNKFSQARPTTVWWDRQINSVATFWQVPDGNGPYVLFYRATLLQLDIRADSGYGVDAPIRFMEAYVSGLAAKLAISYPPPQPNTAEKMDQLAERAFQYASRQDSENVPLYISPGLESVYR
jgi:hypothetical protein